MIGILLITHGALGEALIQCACHVMNRRPLQLMQLGMAGQDDPLDALPLARRLLEITDDGVLILTDILGATPPTPRPSSSNPAGSKAWRASICRCCCA